MARRRISWLAGAVLSTVFLFIAGTSQAASYALVEVRFFFDGWSNANGGVPIVDYPLEVGGDYTFPGLVTVGTGPTPSIMIGEGDIVDVYSYQTAGGTIMFSPGGAITQSSPSPYSVYFNFNGPVGQKNGAASLMKSHGTSNAGSAMFPATTTLCSNSCNPKTGTVWQTPGANRYGGTARLINYGYTAGLRKNFSIGGFTQQLWKVTYAPNMTGDAFFGNYGEINTIMVTTPNGAEYLTQGLGLEGSFTTGIVRAKISDPANAYPTDVSKTGSFTFNTAANTGMISLVQPKVDQGYSKVNGVVVGQSAGFGNSSVRTTRLTFLPEPGQLLLLGVGILGLTALYGRRR